jgi:hypothetical protein
MQGPRRSHVSLNPSELIEAMENAFAQAWQVSRGSALPQAGAEDRRLLFEGVARGLLQFIDGHQKEVLTEITFQEAGEDAQAHTVVGAKFDIGRS